MLKHSDSKHCPWIFVNADSKKKTRIECIKYVLNALEYDGKADSKISLKPDKDVINLYRNL